MWHFQKVKHTMDTRIKVIIDRKQFLNLLDRLNQGIYDMMDQYEQTRQSRSNAERAFRKKGDEIIEAANANAEDVYALHLSFIRQI